MNDDKRIKWLIPQEHTLTTTEECQRYLKAGFVLINNAGHTVHYGLDGTQVVTNPNRRHKGYKFSRPHLWQVLNQEATEAKGYTTVYNTKTLWFRLYYYISRIGEMIL